MPRARLYREHRWRPPHALRFDVGESLGYGRRSQQEDGLWWRAQGGAGVFVVIDGMGGHATGEWATRALIGALDDLEPRSPEALMQGLREGHQRVVDLQRQEPRYNGLGMTCAALVLTRGVAFMSWVGDARVYRWRAGRLDRLTTDHSLLELYMASGLLDTDEAVEAFPYKNVITQALGMPSAAPDCLASRAEPLLPGDRFLCCTDGVSDCVDEGLIAALFAERRAPQDIADTLAAHAERHPQAENHTTLVIDPLPDDPTDD